MWILNLCFDLGSWRAIDKNRELKTFSLQIKHFFNDCVVQLFNCAPFNRLKTNKQKNWMNEALPVPLLLHLFDILLLSPAFILVSLSDFPLSTALNGNGAFRGKFWQAVFTYGHMHCNLIKIHFLWISLLASIYKGYEGCTSMCVCRQQQWRKKFAWSQPPVTSVKVEWIAETAYGYGYLLSVQVCCAQLCWVSVTSKDITQKRV